MPPSPPSFSPTPDPNGPEEKLEMEDLTRLLTSVHESTGMDFREYAYSSLRRRIAGVIKATGTGSIAGLHSRLKEPDPPLGLLLKHLTVHTTAMFRDPGFFKLLRTQVIPVLRTYPFIRIWIAGCSTGEELYSLSILMHEEGLAPRCRIYATDLSELVLERARAGVFPLSAMQEYSRNYHEAGGTAPFSDYYFADSEFVVFRKHLRDNVVFGTHNLVSDASFNDFHLILCRNVMIYFRRELQERVHKLFHDSLVMFGYLGLGRSEAVRFTAYRDAYDTVNARERLFRKIK